MVKSSLEKTQTKLKDFTLEELTKATKKLKNNKASGPDGIPAEMLKNSPESLLTLILNLMNKIKKTSYYPEEWASGITSLIPKGGDEEDPNNYRPITVANVLSKILAIMINERIAKQLEEEQTINPVQIGFKKKARPADHLFVLKNCMDSYLSKGKKIYACFVDFQKAYDNVWRMGMYYKLLKYGICSDTVKLIKNMYDKTTQMLKVNNQITEPFKTYKGVRQGCVLSPRLFNLFMNDLPDIFGKKCNPIKLGRTSLPCLMYADDIVLLSETKEGLQECLNRLDEYTTRWGMTLNKGKTKIMIFQNCGRTPSMKFTFKGEELEQVKKYKYLGTMMTNTGNFGLNDKYLKNKGLRARYVITKSIGQNCKPSMAMRLFNKMVEPILLYNCEITQAFFPVLWNQEKFNNKIWDRSLELDKVTYGFLRQILGISKKTTNMGILSETGRHPICTKIFIQMIKYWTRLFTTESNLLQEAHLECIERFKEGKTSWLKIIVYLLQYTEMVDLIDSKDMEQKKKTLDKTFRERILKRYENQWNEDTQKGHEGKLRFYFEHKKIFRFEGYLDAVPLEDRRAITKFRLSCHRLPIEVLRYTKKKKVEKEERLCEICPQGEIGDEWHYLLSCNNIQMDKARREFITTIKNIVPQCTKMDTKQIITYCMNMGDHNIQLPTAIYIKVLLDKYHQEENTEKTSR